MSSVLSTISLLAGLLALVRSTWERRAANRLPIVDLLRDRFSSPQFSPVLIGFATGTIVVLGPFGLSLGLGWVQPHPVGDITGNALFLGLTTILIKMVWAAIEELIFRGALLPQLSKLTNGLVGLAVSSLLFTWGHLERQGARAPDILSLLVFGLDGAGFGIAYLATRNLWMPTIWHAAKNIWVWLLFSESTLQLTRGIFQASYSGPPLWVGASNQAGLLDVVVSFVTVALLATIYRRQLVQGVEWIKSQ